MTVTAAEWTVALHLPRVAAEGDGAVLGDGLAADPGCVRGAVVWVAGHTANDVQAWSLGAHHQIHLQQ